MTQPRWLGVLVSFAIIVAAVCVVPIVPARACLWDSDTLRMEAKAFPGLAEILTGRIERFPARYYQMRLERVAALVTQQPGVLEHYDDLGVVCDRLGRSDEAVEWMRRKLEAMKGLPESAAVKEHRYRYHANLGTFLAHRWLRAGAKGATTDELADLKAGRDEIRAAIAINPDAHFGRERTQLAAMEWLMTARSGAAFEYESIMDVQAESDPEWTIDSARAKKLDEAVKGLSGLIVLGDAWESVDVHYALEQALRARGDASMAELAFLRRKELIEGGMRSLHVRYDATLTEHAKRLHPGSLLGVGERHAATLAEYFGNARMLALAWSMARAEFMEKKLGAGEHPDVQGELFWSGWNDLPKPPRMPERSWMEVIGADAVALTITVAVGAVMGCVFVVVLRRVRRGFGSN
ncbi:MAG: hypothetical protein IBJ18_07130 [Phycisphaerales bacterium]|nr:hypothetical protein [Phycisphaerales bacterium]